MSLLSRLGRYGLSARLVAFTAFVVGYGFSFRMALPAAGAGFGSFETAALFFTDPYHVLFIAVPAWLVAACVVVIREGDYASLIRTGSRLRWIWRTMRLEALALWIPSILVMLAAAFVISIGLRPSPQWVAFVQHPDSTSFSPAMKGIGLAPVSLIGAQVLSFFTFALATWATIAVIFVVTRSRLAVSGFALLVFVAAIVSHVLFASPGTEWLLETNFLSPLSSQSAYGSWWAGSLIAAAWAVAMLLCAAAADRRRRHASPGARTWWVAYGCATFGLLVVAAHASPSGPHTMWWSIVLVFQGATAGGSSLPFYLLSALIFLTPVYLYAARFELYLGGWGQYTLLRSRSYWSWFLRPLSGTLSQTLLLLGVVFAGGVAAHLLSVAPGPGAVAPGRVPAGPVLYQFFVNGLLQITFYVLVCFACMWITGRTSASLIVLGSVFVCGFLPLTSLPVLPVFLNSLSAVWGGWPALLQSTTSLVIWNAAVLALIGWLFARRRIAV